MFNALPHGVFARLAIIAIGATLLAAPARADDGSECDMTYEQSVEIAHKLVAADPNETFTDYSGADASDLIDTMNAIEPVSSWSAEHIIVIDPSGDEPFRVGIVDRGCVAHAFAIPRGAWMAIVADALGVSS